MNVAIESGLPIPERMALHPRRCPQSAALRALKVGDSMVYPAKKGEAPARTQRRVLGLVGHLIPKKFSTRTVREDGSAVIRVWRVS